MPMQRRTFIKGLSGLFPSPLLLGIAPSWAQVSATPKTMPHSDVLIVGSGVAGLSAAVSALESGAKHVTLLEKSPLLGGHSILSTGSVSVAFPDPETGATEENVRRMMEDTLAAGGKESDPQLVRLLAEKSYDAILWLERLGVRWNRLPFRAVSSSAERNISTGSVRAGYDYVQVLLHAARRLGVEIRYRTKATSLLLSAERVTGVEARDAQGQVLHFPARAVVLATGGFTADPVMRRRYDPRLSESLRTTANPQGWTLDGSTGDGIVMAEAIGARTIGMSFIQVIPFIGGRVTDYVGGEIWLNARGERFVNEEERFGKIYEAILAQPEGRLWIITDSQSKKNASFASKMHTGAVQRADSIEEMARAMELPETKLLETLREYNDAVDRGRDERFGRTLFTQRIDTPPYFFGEERFAVHFSCGGLAIDERARVLDHRNHTIPGLFAAGETTGGLHGRDRLGGNSLIDCFVFGRIAGSEAARK